MIGPAEWRQAARSHDGLLLTYSPAAWKFQAAAAYNQNAERQSSTSYGLNQYKAMGILYAERDTGRLRGFFLTIADGTQNLYSGGEEIDWKVTGGGKLSYHHNRFQAEAGGYVQRGVRFLNGKSIRAFMVNTACSIPFNRHLWLARADILSGQNESDAYTSFDNLYASRHRYFGYMDYYVTLPQDVREGGLTAFMLGYRFIPSVRHSIQTDFHLFRLQQPVADLFTGELTGRDLGSEVDLLYQFTWRADVVISLGQSFYLPGDDLEEIKGGYEKRINTFSYMMVAVNPVLFQRP